MLNNQLKINNIESINKNKKTFYGQYSLYIQRRTSLQRA